MGWIPSLWTSFRYQKFWREVLRLKINEDKPHLTIVPLSKEAKTTFGHYSKKLGPWPMILGHYTKWVRGSIWPIHNFYSLLLKKLRKLEKTVNFWSKLKLPKKCVPHLLWTPDSLGELLWVFGRYFEKCVTPFFRLRLFLDFKVLLSHSVKISV